jgi:predicted nucleic acid-binding protein
MLKRDRIALSEAQKGISIFNLIQIRYIETDFDNALSLSKTLNVYAYDAYILDYAMRSNSSLLTLDNKLLDAARKLGITSLEV